MRYTIIIILAVLACITTSCFEEDQPVPPYVPPYDVVSVSLENSIYTSQVYFDFGTGSIAAVNDNSAWTLAFECSRTGYHIRINSSDFWGVALTGSTRIDSVFSDISDYEWKADKADGNADSTAIGDWITGFPGSPIYTNEVYLVGKYNGIAYLPAKKVQFIEADSLSYTMKIGDPGSSVIETVVVQKDPEVNNVQFSFEGNSTLKLEPPKEDWDVLFCQYHTILLTDDGIPAPYFVRGVLLNPVNVEAALDTLNKFEAIGYQVAAQMEFSSGLDAIGHDWKSVTVDQASNSAEYKVRPGYSYIIKDTGNELYKLRFKSYFNDSGIKGYPSFEFARLDPD